MLRPPALLTSRSSAIRLTGLLGAILLVAGLVGAGVAGLRPDLVPVDGDVPEHAVGGAGLALGIGVAAIGAMHLAVWSTAHRSASAAAAGAVGAAAMGAAVMVGAVSALVAGAMPLVPPLVLGVAAYAWIAVLLAAPGHRGGGGTGA